MLLNVKNLHAHYGKSHVLQGVDFAVDRGQIVSVIGRNGSGRSTMIKAIVGLIRPSQGSILLDGVEQSGRPAFDIVRGGIAFVPEERLAFNNLTVDENLMLGRQPAQTDHAAWTVEQMYGYFPSLRERRNTNAGHLSGGEQQMLTICRSLLTNPKIILIDEPTEGLAPKIVERVVEVVRDIQRHGVAVVLVEQKMTIALEISDSVNVMGHGQIVFTGTPDEMRANDEVRRTWLEVS